MAPRIRTRLGVWLVLTACAAVVAASPAALAATTVKNAKPAASKAGKGAAAKGKRPRAAAVTRARGSQARATTARRRRPSSVELFHINRKERMLLRLADERGRPVRGLDRKASRFFRCHHTNAQHRIDPRLIRLIYNVGQHYQGKRIEVVSGYRHPKVATNPKSPHKQGLACDFRVKGVKNAELRDYLRKSFKHVGIGYYPNSSFVHLDVRDGRSAFWIDYSGPGQRSMYADDPKTDLKNGRADSFRPAQIDPSWVDEPTTQPPAVQAEPVQPPESTQVAPSPEKFPSAAVRAPPGAPGV